MDAVCLVLDTWLACLGQSFRAAATVKADTETVLFAFGDLGVTLPWTTWQEQQPPSNLTVHWIDQLMRNTGNKSTSVFHIGDISYARWVVHV